MSGIGNRCLSLRSNAFSDAPLNSKLDPPLPSANRLGRALRAGVFVANVKGLVEASLAQELAGGVLGKPVAGRAMDGDFARFKEQGGGQRGDAGQADRVDAA